MIGFRNFMERAPVKKYVAVQYDVLTQNRLQKWSEDNGFDLSIDYEGNRQNPKDFDFHTTIFYTTSMHHIPNYMKNIAPSGSAKVVDIMMLGVNNDIPVLKIESPMILQLRKHYAEVYDMRDEWPEYKPHVSVSYSKILPNMSKVRLPDFELTFNRVKVADGSKI
jgi:hypothetical protein